MITFNQAERIALDAIRSDHVLMSDLTEEIDLGWHFMHQPKMYVETGEVRYMVVSPSLGCAWPASTRVTTVAKPGPLRRDLGPSSIPQSVSYPKTPNLYPSC